MSTTEASITATTLALGVGGIAKRAEAFPDRFIPALVAVVGAVTVPALAGWTLENFVAGLTAGLSATGANQLSRQLGKSE